MTLPLPILDVRTFTEMVEEGRSMIPGTAPVWTDFNYHDPGITLVDLLAWLTEQDIYRLDRVTDAGYRSFLRLAGVQPRPPLVADSILAFSISNQAHPQPFPAGVQVESSDGTVIFQTVDDLWASPSTLTSLFAGPEAALVDCTKQNQSSSGHFLPFGSNPVVGDSLYLGFNQPPADQAVKLSLYVWVGNPEADKATRARLISEWKSATETAEVYCRAEDCPDDSKAPMPVPSDSSLPEIADIRGWWQHYSARTVWEFYATPGVWTPLTQVTDETRALTLSGPVSFLAPAGSSQLQGGLPGGQAPKLYFIRCRLANGGFECPPDIRRIAFNAVRAHHAADIAQPEHLGISTGRAQQDFSFRHKPVVAHSSKLTVRAAGSLAQVPWTEEPSWDSVGPHANSYVLAPETGQITFGDGRIGRVPQAGADIEVQYQVGGGAAGNVPACTLKVPAPWSAWPIPVADIAISMPVAATGGTDAELLSAALVRAYVELTEVSRAVTLSDFQTLARAVPGVPVARAFALANYDPDFPCFSAAGCVTVVVLPPCPDTQPQPTPGFLEAVARYLERRRPVTTEVRVVGPSYTIVSVSARLNAVSGVDAQMLAQQAQAALAAFLNPLLGGPQQNGWPVGRGVYSAEILTLLNALPGVVYVDALTLQADQGPRMGCANLTICPHGLVASGQHQISVATYRGKT
jgi:predicted phage baseplate assembly protein